MRESKRSPTYAEINALQIFAFWKSGGGVRRMACGSQLAEFSARFLRGGAGESEEFVGSYMRGTGGGDENALFVQTREAGFEQFCVGRNRVFFFRLPFGQRRRVKHN